MKPSKPAKNRKEMIAIIADKTGIVPIDVQVTLDVFVKELAFTLREHGSLTMTALGTFKNVDGDITFKPSTAFNNLLT